MKIALPVLCCFLLFATRAIAEVQDEAVFTGQINAGGWQGQLEMTYSHLAAIDITQNYLKHLVCTDAGNTDDQGTCIAWGCWASFTVPFKVSVTISGPGFTSTPVVAWDHLQYGIPQKDCTNPALELSGAFTQLQRSVVSIGLEGIQTGGSTTTGLAGAYVSAAIVPGAQPGTALLTNFSYDKGTPQIGLANPNVFLSEYRGTLTRVK